MKPLELVIWAIGDHTALVIVGAALLALVTALVVGMNKEMM